MTDIEVYFSYIFNPKSFEYSHVKSMLNSYCGLKGNSTAGYMDCYFSPEWQDYGLEYFGEDKVLFAFHAPAVDEDRQVIISYREFYEIVSKYYTEYANQHLEEKEEILYLLGQLKKRLNVKQSTNLDAFATKFSAGGSALAVLLAEVLLAAKKADNK